MEYPIELFPEINGALDSEGDLKPLTDFDDSFGAEYPETSCETEPAELAKANVVQEKTPQPYKPGPLERRFDVLQDTMSAEMARSIVGAKALDAEISASLGLKPGETPEAPAPKRVRLNYKTGPAFVRAALEAARKEGPTSSNPDTK